MWNGEITLSHFLQYDITATVYVEWSFNTVTFIFSKHEK